MDLRPADDPIRRRADELMSACADGDDAAFDQLHPILIGWLRPYCARKAPSDPDDVIQKTLLRVWLARGTFRRGAPVRPWVFSIATRMMIDDRRRHSVFRRVSDELLWRSVSDTEVEAALQYLLAAEVSARLEAAMAKLSPAERQAIELTKFAGLSLEEAAEVAGTTVGGMKSRIHRAYVALRASLEEDA